MLPSLSIVLPCYNPLENWEQTVIDKVLTISKCTNLKELIIVNDGSLKPLTQALDRIAENCPVPLIRIEYNKNEGKGYAIRKGLEKASGQVIIYTDIDFPYRTNSFLDIYQSLSDKQAAIVVGVKDIAYYDTVPLLRRWISKILKRMIRLLFHMQITDTQCGLKGLTQESKHIWLAGKVNRYLFDLEALYRASRQKISMKAIPVKLREGIVFTKIPFTILFRELKNLVTILRNG